MKYLVFSLLVLTQLTLAKAQQTKVLMIINEGFQPAEYLEPRALFEKEGYLIKTASRYGGKTAPGRKYTDVAPVNTDYSFEQIKIEDFDVVTFTGGGGAWSDYFPNKTLHKVLVTALASPRLVVGLICAGTGLLATANNLDGRTPQFAGRKITGYGEVEGLLTQVGKLNYSSGDLSKPYVVVDKNLVTGRDPMSSKLFGENLIAIINKR